MKGQKVSIANLPTRIERLKGMTKRFDKNIYIKRDDQTGTEVSGNKVRKLEYVIKEALDQGCDTLITCGGVQSNHCRSTIAAGIKFGLKTIVLLRTDEQPDLDGNYFLNKILGGEIRLLSSQDYQNHLEEIMNNTLKELESQGRKGYIVPMGASNSLGTWGYFECFEEILRQEKEMGISFDTIVCTLGSGGTYSGLLAGNKVFDCGKNIIGINIIENEGYNKNQIVDLTNEFLEKNRMKGTRISLQDIHIIDQYVGRGYALNQPEELDFIVQFAGEEGIILDPVYTGKAMYGFYNELMKNSCQELRGAENILFIHTGGLYGLFPKKHEFVLK